MSYVDEKFKEFEVQFEIWCKESDDYKMRSPKDFKKWVAKFAIELLEEAFNNKDAMEMMHYLDQRLTELRKYANE